MHQPSGGLGGTASDIKIQAEQMIYTKRKMAELIARGSDRGADRARPSRPLVHRGRGARLLVDKGCRAPTRSKARARSPDPHHASDDSDLHREGSPPMSELHLPSARYVIPEFEERTSQGRRRHNPYTKLFEERIFTRSADRRRVRQRRHGPALTLESMDPDRDISIYINSPGGSFIS